MLLFNPDLCNKNMNAFQTYQENKKETPRKQKCTDFKNESGWSSGLLQRKVYSISATLNISNK